MGQLDRRMIVDMLDIKRREEKRKEESVRERERVKIDQTTSQLPHDAYGIIIQNKNKGKRE